jgi:hypothetical protein
MLFQFYYVDPCRQLCEGIAENITGRKDPLRSEGDIASLRSQYGRHSLAKKGLTYR